MHEDRAQAAEEPRALAKRLKRAVLDDILENNYTDESHHMLDVITKIGRLWLS